MGWQDRDYNSGGSTSDYFGNPLALFNLSVPFGTWGGVRVRLHFWLLFSFLMTYVAGIRAGDVLWSTVVCVLTLLALLAHEFGHRLCARWVGGSHNEFMLWPFGGMIPPNAPPFPGQFFLTHFGGIFANLLCAVISAGTLLLIAGVHTSLPLNPLLLLGGAPFVGHATLNAALLGYLYIFCAINVGIICINLLPYYWFDGGNLLQAILWPFTQLYQAINVTCIVGMVLAVPLLLLSLLAGPGGIFMMIFWALLFASSYTKRKQLKAAGTGEFEDAIAWSANYNDPTPTGGGLRKNAKVKSLSAARKIAKAEQAEQAKIDAILSKVKDRGLHSLSWGEKRTLKKATERQRKRDLAKRR